MFKCFLACLLFSSLSLLAAPRHVANFDDAASLAKQKRLPYFVLIHGSSWHKASRNFIRQVWNDEGTRRSLEQSFIYTEIEIKQQLTKEQAKKEGENRKAWKKLNLVGYPVIQIYSYDGILLNQYQGASLREIATKSGLAALFKDSLSAIEKRNLILKQIKQANTDNKPEQEIQLIGKLVSLPLKYNKKTLLKQLKELDPEDKTGWQDRVTFNNWSYIRHITGLLKSKKVNQAIKENNTRLAKDYYTAEQRAFLLSAKGMIVNSTGDHKEAWKCFQEALKLAPDSPGVEALFRYGERVSMLPLRSGFSKGSELYGENIGVNISRDHATFTMSSIAYDDKTGHSSLFKGDYLNAAFHTNKEKTAHIIIDLKALCTVNAVQVLNINTRNSIRAKTLTIYTSKDQENWTKVWQAKEAKQEWQILLKSPAKARYLKLALDSSYPEFLHLKGVNVFGKRP